MARLVKIISRCLLVGILTIFGLLILVIAVAMWLVKQFKGQAALPAVTGLPVIIFERVRYEPSTLEWKHKLEKETILLCQNKPMNKKAALLTRWKG